MNLHLDIETYSPTDLKKSGAHRYAEDAEVLLVAWSLEDGPISVEDLTVGPLSPHLRCLLQDPHITKWADNAAFERTLLRAVLGIHCPPERWRCTMAWSLSTGLPGSLGEVAKVLNLRQQKGSPALMRFFCSPCKPTKANGHVTRNLAADHPEKWAQFIEYCRQDVATEKALYTSLQQHPMRPEDWRAWEVDQHINDRGVRVDLPLVKAAIELDVAGRATLVEEAAKLLPEGTNANSVSQLKAWLTGESGEDIADLTKKTVKTLLKNSTGVPARVLQIRQELGKSSVAKYVAIRDSVCRDGRVRGLFQFSGAARTGRAAGRLVQVQNLPQNHISGLEYVREMIKQRDLAGLTSLYGPLAQTLSEALRTAFVGRLTVVDYSAVEARFLAWVADEKWRLDVFRSHGKIYEASAAKMLGIPISSVTKAQRFRGKVAELALGYGGAEGALTTMGALDMGLTLNDMTDIKNAWRKANAAIVQLWYAMEKAAWRATLERGSHEVNDKVRFERFGNGPLKMILPSGRALTYLQPSIQMSGKFEGREALTFKGVHPKTHRWGTIDTFGGRLTENLCQAGCNDILREALVQLHDCGRQTVMHIHDEVVIDDDGTLEDAVRVFGITPTWAPGLPLRGDGFQTAFYKKED